MTQYDVTKKGLKVNTIDEYIASQPEELRPTLNKVRTCIKEALPFAQERISYQMPTYWYKVNLIHFAAQKKHLGLYPRPEAVEHFKDKLQGYKTSKGAIQIPYDEPLPLELISEIAMWCGENYRKEK
ncbi:MAG: hypothetical protein GX490_09980 [Bacilli bacterium]|nr:hypothetical protein [Bacilli bacterium]